MTRLTRTLNDMYLKDDIKIVVVLVLKQICHAQTYANVTIVQMRN